MDPIYVTGHRNPDTDSIVAAMAYASLRNALGDREYEAACLGPVSDETQLVLDYFGFQPPKRLYNMYTQVRDLEYDQPPILDVGVKALGVDQGMPAPVGFTAEGIAAHEEHLILTRPSRPLTVGERVRLIPGHCCSTVNLYDKIYLFKDDTVTGRLFVTARGKSR